MYLMKCFWWKFFERILDIKSEDLAYRPLSTFVLFPSDILFFTLTFFRQQAYSTRRSRFNFVFQIFHKNWDPDSWNVEFKEPSKFLTGIFFSTLHHLRSYFQYILKNCCRFPKVYFHLLFLAISTLFLN